MSLAVSVRPEPFAFARGLEMPDGLTVAEIAARAPIARTFRGDVLVMVNGHEILPEHWKRTRILNVSRVGAPVIVTIDPLPQGSKGAQQLLMIAGAVALTVATVWIGGGALAPFLGPAFGAGTFGAQAAAAALGFVGSLALQALAPPPLSPESNSSNIKTKQLAGVSANVPALLEQIPTVAGRMRVSPPLMAPAFTSLTQDCDTKVSLVVGLTGQHFIAGIQINGSRIEDMENIEYETREGWSDDDPLDLVTITVLEERPQQKMDEFKLKGDAQIELESQGQPNTSKPKWQTFTTRGEADQLTLRLYWPQGMIKQDEDDATLKEAAMPVRLQMRLQEDNDWINLPELHFRMRGDTPREVRQQIHFIWNDVVPDPVDGTGQAYAAFWNAAPGKTWEWEADSYFDPGSSIYAARVANSKAGFVIYLDPDVFPKGVYEVRIVRGLAYKRTNFAHTSSTYEYTGDDDIANFFDFYDDSGTFKVRIAQDEFSTTTLLESFSTLRNDYPIEQAGLTLLAVTGVNVQINSISALFTKYAPIVTAGVWTTEYEPTQNPAALLREVWTGELNAQAKPLSIVDDNNLIDFYEDCVANGYECNAIIEAGQSVKGVAQLIASTGYAAIAEFEKWGVVMDRDRSADPITQLYTPLNTKNFRVERALDDIPHAIKAEFINSEDRFKFEERVVYREGFTAMTAELFEAVRYPGFTTEAAIDERVTRDFRQLSMRDKRFVFETGLENLRTPQGALCGITHDVLADSHFFSYVRAKTIDTGNIVSIELEAEIDFAAAMGDAAAVGARIRLRDGSTIVKEIDETTASNVATFTTPFTNTADLEKDCLVAFGPLAAETRRVVVLEIEPLDDDRARLVCLDEAPEVYAVSPPTAFSATLDGVDVDLEWTLPDLAFYDEARVHRAAGGDDFEDASEIATVSAGDPQEYTDVDPGGGAWRYWVTAHNLAGTSSEPTGPEDVTVPTAAEVLADGRADVIAIDFIDRSMWVADAGTPANDFDGAPGSCLTHARAGAKYVFGADGLLDSITNDILGYDHHPITLAPRGIWLTNQATDLLAAGTGRDFTDAAWTKTNVTAAKNQIGLDGVTNSASLLTATAANGTVTQAVTSASANRIFQVWIKRVTGTGTIEVTVDGTNWTDVTSRISTAGFALGFRQQNTVTNPVVGIRIGTSGDAVIADFANLNNQFFASAPVDAGGSRIADALSFASNFPSWLASPTAITIAMEFELFDIGTPPNVNLLNISDGTASERHFISRSSSIRASYVVTDGGVAQAGIVHATDSLVAETIQRIATSAAAADFRLCQNGVMATQDTAGTMPGSFNVLWLLRSATGGSQGTAWLRRVLIFPATSTDVELQALLT